MALHFKCSLLDLDNDQLQDYLYLKKRQHKTPSDSFFKHTVYGLRYLYKVFGLPEHTVVLPSIERPKKLPVVLSCEEIKLLLKTPRLLKHLQCPYCKKGNLVTLTTFDSRGPPKGWLEKLHKNPHKTTP